MIAFSLALQQAASSAVLHGSFPPAYSMASTATAQSSPSRTVALRPRSDGWPASTRFAKVKGDFSLKLALKVLDTGWSPARKGSSSRERKPEGFSAEVDDPVFSIRTLVNLSKRKDSY